MPNEDISRAGPDAWRTMKAFVLALSCIAALAGSAMAQTPSPVDEQPQARIARLEAEERRLRREQDPARALEVLRELVDALDGSPRQGPMLLSLYLSERDAGNLSAAAGLRKKLLESPHLHVGVRIGYFFREAQYRAWIGDLAGARDLWAQGSAAIAGVSPNDRIAQRLMHRYRARQATAEAAILRMEGNLAGAERALQLALAENASDLARFDARAGGTAMTIAEERDLATVHSDRALLQSELVGLHIQSNRFGAAELVAQAWQAAAQQGGGQQAYALLAAKRYGDVMLAAGRCEKALEAFDKTIAGYRAQQRSEVSTNLVFVRRSRAQALMCLDRWQDALDGFRELERDTRGSASRLILRGGIDRALVRLMTGDLAGAEQMIDAAIASLMKSFGPDHASTIAANGIRAIILSRRGQDEEALPLFRRYADTRLNAVADNVQESEESAHDRLRKRLILEAYLAALSRRAGDGESVAVAFQIADALRAGRVQQAIAAAAVRGAIRDGALAELVRSEQTQGAELAALYKVLAERDDEGRAKGDAAFPDLRPRIESLEKERRQTAERIRQQFPDYFRLVRPAPPTPADVGALLTEGEVMLSIYPAADVSYVFAVTPQGATRLHVAPVGAAALGNTVRRLRQALDVGEIPLESLPAFDIAAAYQLHSQLLEPLRAHWGQARHLVVTSAGSLAQLPFSLLVERPVSPAKRLPPFSGYGDVPWLVKSHAISHVPSAAAFVALRRLPAASAGRTTFVGFGDPDFGAPRAAPGSLRKAPNRGATGAGTTSGSLRAAYAALPPLPDTRDEVLALAKALRANPEDAILGRAASRDAVMTRDLSRATVLAFATHGLQPGELPGLDEPALAMTLPQAETQSPLLTLSDVLALRLDADWVLLSACNTAGADDQAAEALSGLGRGFFFAGARALLVTHWPVETTSARQLVSALFAQPHADTSRAESLRQAQLSLMRQSAGKSFSYAHPLFWAAFALVGDGGGKR